MRGVTNAAPAGGGLKVIAEGAGSIGRDNSKTVTLPAPAKVVIVSFNPNISEHCEVATVLPNDYMNRISDFSASLFPDGMTLRLNSISASSAAQYEYLALG